MEKSHDLRNEVRGSGRAACSITRNKRKEPIIPANVDTPTDEMTSCPWAVPHL